MAKAPTSPAEPSGDPKEPKICGIIMPIAGMPGYDASHWVEVLELLGRGIEMAGWEPRPVWSGGAADIIQERIVRNLFELPMAVCDVSGLNPNVMLELGIRLAFGKPTIIVTDELVEPPFDINAIEYVPYPRDLHILRTERFLSDLAAKIEAIERDVEARTYRPFIKTFGPIEPGTPGSEGVTIGQAVLEQLEQLSSSVRRLERSEAGTALVPSWAAITTLEQQVAGSVGVFGENPLDRALLIEVPSVLHVRVAAAIKTLPGVQAVETVSRGMRIAKLRVTLTAEGMAERTYLRSRIAKIIESSRPETS